MTTRKDNFESLIAQARGQTPPRVDVTARVVRSIERREVAPMTDRQSLAIAAAAVAAASVALAMAWQSRTELQNPLVELYRPPVFFLDAITHR